MSRVISFRDLLLIEELNKYNEIELLHPSMDETVGKYLGQLGFDTDYGILYVPNKHRDMKGNVAVGFRAVGEISCNREFINSPLCSTIERIIAASYQDPSLAQELSIMHGNSINFAALHSPDVIDENDEFPLEYIEEDYEEVLQQLKTLTDIRDTIRGTYLNEYGNIKTLAEYAEVDNSQE